MLSSKFSIYSIFSAFLKTVSIIVYFLNHQKIKKVIYSVQGFYYSFYSFKRTIIFHQELIPLGCCQTVYYSSEYIKSYQCKLLGLSDKVQPIADQSTSSDDNIDAGSTERTIFGDLNEFIYLKVGFTPRPDQLRTTTDMAVICDVTTALKLESLEFPSLYELIQKKNFIDVNVQTNVTNIDNQSKASYLQGRNLE